MDQPVKSTLSAQGGQPDFAELLKKYKKKSRGKEVWRSFKKNKIAMVGLFIFSIIIICTIFADLIVPYNDAIAQTAAPASGVFLIYYLHHASKLRRRLGG